MLVAAGYLMTSKLKKARPSPPFLGVSDPVASSMLDREIYCFEFLISIFVTLATEVECG